MTLTLGIDIGGTSVRAMAFDSAGKSVARSQVMTVTDDGDSVVDSVLEAWTDLGCIDKVSAAGVGVPGQVDPSTGDVRMAVNLGIGEEPFPLGEVLTARLGVPVSVENDVKVAALGVHEDLRAQGESPKSLVLVNVGTGISAGVIIGGALFRGSRGMAGEIGHVVVDQTGPLCRCGQTGCLEAVAAGPAMARKGTEEISRYLAYALTWLAATYDPDLLFLGGGVTQAGGSFLEGIRKELRAAAANSPLAAQRLDPDSIVLAPIDGTTGPKGAAVLAQRLQPKSNASNQTGGEET